MVQFLFFSKPLALSQFDVGQWLTLLGQASPGTEERATASASSLIGQLESPLGFVLTECAFVVGASGLVYSWWKQAVSLTHYFPEVEN